jgi:membrane protease YdiL (CAAX protease family)
MTQKEYFGVDIKIWLTLVLASSISGLLVIPYSLEFAGQSIPPLPEFLQLALLAFIQYAVMFGILAFLGLWISKKIGLEPTPVLSGKTRLREHLTISVVSGIAAGVAIVLLNILLNFLFVFPDTGPGSGNPGAFVGFLASFYGGIAEEVLLRLFFVSFLCLLIIGAMKLPGYAKSWKHTDTIVWVSVVIAAIVFGLAHLPATAVIMAITPAVILRAVLLNGIGGVVFGWLFFRKGLEFAMISHFSLDIILHVILPLAGYSLL